MVGVMKIIFLMVTPIIFNTFVYNASSYLDSKIFSDILNMKGIVAKVVSGQWGEYSNYYITPVSYTHLDVYKRQEPCFEPVSIIRQS